MPPPKQTGASYAKSRRAAEGVSREALKAVVPSKYFTTVIEEDGNLNQTAKVMVAATQFIQTLNVDVADEGGKNDGEESDSDDSDRPLALRRRNKHVVIADPAEPTKPEEIRQLHQVAQRIVQKAHEQMEGQDHMPEPLRSCLEEASNTIIDLIENIEQAGSKV